ncbi:NACHT domain-containing protein [Phormidium sp. LEGE 05292]|uniref:NACHT C-terminal alpha/beta 1 domain-containing protein n=1 Tax=[Phormidium] sp. LEGE 05292 TaxID=767427 RepID=UPI001881A0B1|nr:NACHT domain-containing protein [Phormidium sp. LEGE 05292]MBE9226902.1 NACHT domain-containing protein [Phormidium sp. LEGE 05292]
MTTASKRRRGFLASREGLAILEAERLKKGFTHETLTEAAKLNSDDQVRRLFNPHWGKGIQRDAIEKIAAVLELQPTEFIEDWLPKCRSSKQKQTVMNPNDIDLREVCLVMLEQQQKEQRIRRKATEQGFELKVYVPLGLVERQKQQRRSGNVPMDLVHQLEKEVITRIYQHDEFLNDVIGHEFVGKNKHIAIVGEPGAGKTTLLDNIATYIQKNTEDLPICISLASLQGRNLKNYILEEWLPEALSLTYPDIDVETLHETSLQKRLRQGGVWLLLDGVDEMGETNILEKIQSQLTDWLGKVRVVLTCRTNVWDAKTNNPLTGFETYKTQNFSQGDVRRFIKQWFGFARKPQLGKVLREKLNEPQSDRIRQLVENPLRLALLCQVFNRDEKAELPETKAGLYELFVRYFYEWKPTLSSVDWTTQLGLKEELHQALGRLSIAGLDSDARFRLPESLIKKELDDRLFKLVWELGWLNLVDREAKNDESVYAFFHPTFQEYFAAVVIDDWGYFLPKLHNNQNPKLVQDRYRIFEPQWEEVILIWVGRNNVQTKEFIESLLMFRDGCGNENFYWYRAWFLAAKGIVEFKNCDPSLVDKIIWQLIQWSCTRRWVMSDPLSDEARDVLPKTNTIRAIYYLTLVLRSEQSEPIHLLAATSLVKIAPGYPEAIDTLIKLMRYSQWEPNEWLAARVLLSIDPNHPEATEKLADDWAWEIHQNSLQTFYEKSETIAKVIKILCFSSDKLSCLQAAENLLKIEELEHSSIVSMLVDALRANKDTVACLIIAELLGKIGYKNQDAITFLIRLAYTQNLSDDSVITEGFDSFSRGLLLIHIRKQAVESLGKIAFGNIDAINALTYMLKNESNQKIKHQVAVSLVNIDPTNQEVIPVLIEFLSIEQSRNDIPFLKDELLLSARTILFMALLKGSFHREVVMGLKDCVQEYVDKQHRVLSNRLQFCYELVWHCAQNMSYPEFYKAWHEPATTHLEALDNIQVGKSSITQKLNFTQLPSILDSAIAKDDELNKAIKLICIDGSYFSEPNNPATDIYIEMVEQGCPEKQEEPNTMQQLKKYWRLDLRKLEKRIALLFYNSKNDRTLNPSFLSDIATFGGTIAIISDEHCNNVRLISPNDPNLIDTVLKWLRRKILED